MNILAFDTCLGACSVAVGVAAGDALENVESLYEEMATGQAERLMPMIDTAMRTAGIGFAELDRIAVTIGPGTFTGTRIGIAAARALSLATGVGVLGMSTLQLMAIEAAHRLGRAHCPPWLVVAVDAHRGQVYVQGFDTAQVTPATPPQLLALEDAAQLADKRTTLIVGSGAELVVAAARKAGRQAEAALPALQPNAAHLVLAAPSLWAQAQPIRPLYLRPADAKPQAAKSLTRASP